jgi:hypothetical protein
MRKKMRVVREVVREPDATANRVFLNVKVHFDLGEPQDIFDAAPDLEFRLGNLRSSGRGEFQVPSSAHFLSPAVFEGGGIQTTILLKGPNAFTVMSAIKEVHVRKVDMAA